MKTQELTVILKDEIEWIVLPYTCIEAWLIIFFYFLALASVPKETTEISIGRGEHMRISWYLFTHLIQSLKYHRVVNEATF